MKALEPCIRDLHHEIAACNTGPRFYRSHPYDRPISRTVRHRVGFRWHIISVLDLYAERYVTLCNNLNLFFFFARLWSAQHNHPHDQRLLHYHQHPSLRQAYPAPAHLPALPLLYSLHHPVAHLPRLRRLRHLYCVRLEQNLSSSTNQRPRCIRSRHDRSYLGVCFVQSSSSGAQQDVQREKDRYYRHSSGGTWCRKV